MFKQRQQKNNSVNKNNNRTRGRGGNNNNNNSPKPQNNQRTPQPVRKIIRKKNQKKIRKINFIFCQVCGLQIT